MSTKNNNFCVVSFICPCISEEPQKNCKHYMVVNSSITCQYRTALSEYVFECHSLEAKKEAMVCAQHEIDYLSIF